MREVIARYMVPIEAARFNGNTVHDRLGEVAGEKLKWFYHNYPDLKPRLDVSMDVQTMSFQAIWYVDFQNDEDLFHYRLTHSFQDQT